jgi:hypothetical protein
MKINNITVLVLCLFALGLITACQPTEEIDIEDLYGVWRSENSVPFLFLNEDGTFSQAASNNPENPFVFGQWQLEGTTLTSHADDESPWCAGYSISLQVEFIEEDKFKTILIKDDCPEGCIDRTHGLQVFGHIGYTFNQPHSASSDQS